MQFDLVKKNMFVYHVFEISGLHHIRKDILELRGSAHFSYSNILRF